MSVAELREKTVAELQQQLLELRKEQFQMRMANAAGQLSKNHKLRQVRATIAQIKTIMTEKAGATK